MPPAAKKPTENPVTKVIANFLDDLAYAGKSTHTVRAYATDLKQFTNSYHKSLADITADDLRHFFRQHTHLSKASRARKQNSLASFLNWAFKQDLIAANPMAKIDRLRADVALPRAVSRQDAGKILAQIPKEQLRDKLFFHLLFETGLRVGEALELHIENIDLKLDDEHMTVMGKGRKQRTILLDDSRLVSLLRTYLKQTDYKHGYLFRAHKNGRGGHIRYQSIHPRWKKYCEKAGIDCTIHQLRHAHATELVNDGVSLATIRKRLGHKNLQTTLRYAEQSDTVTDDEIRHWRRNKETH